MSRLANVIAFVALLFAGAATPAAAYLLSALKHNFLSSGEGTCASLKNRGSHFTVQIAVGTPAQTLDVVADTGSDSVIVNSCMCVDNGRCSKEDKCFRGINQSSTFSLEGVAQNGQAMELTEKAKVPSLVITFGSGQVETIVASDKVSVGGTEAVMHKGLLLLVDKALEFDGPFEGILGLGLPRNKDTVAKLTEAARKAGQTPDEQEQLHKLMDARGFLQTAGIPRFSMCFNDLGKDGVLRLGQPKADVQLSSVGTVHWGLDFRGVTVIPAAFGEQNRSSASFVALGEAPASRGDHSASFCQHKEEGQDTACGAIPDSGTTLIMGPRDQLVELFEKVCDAWPKCAGAASGGDTTEHKVKRFQKLLMECSSWLEQEDGVASMPTLEFHVAGGDGTESTVSLSPHTYVMEYMTEQVKYVRKHLLGVFDVIAEVPTGKEIKVCSPAFGAQNYVTKKNGPVWILGTPFFYDYQVGYDMEATPPAISFTEKECGACTGNKPAFLSQSREAVQQQKSAAKGPWTLSGPPRVPPLDTSLPL